jgi:prepilin-type N-terminal cleavage/methylation domain-containing protein
MTFQWHKTRRAQGFTLLEVILAVVVFAIVLAAINSVLFVGLKVRATTAGSIERTAPLERATLIIKNDLASLVLPGGTMSGTLQTTPLGNNTLADGTTGPTLAQQSAMLNQSGSGTPGLSSPLFYVSTGIVDETTPWADIAQVYYYLAPPTNRATPGMDLYRSVTHNLLPVLPEEPVNQYLLSGVDTINFYFYQSGTGQINSWVDYWDSTIADPVTLQTNSVPRAIKVRLQLTSSGAARSPVEFVVPVFVQASTNQSSSTSTNSSGG